MTTTHSDKYKPSTKQAKVLRLIKDTLNLTCKDMTAEGVSKFIDDNLQNALSNLKKRPPSAKQIAMIRQIEKALGVKWEGSTISEASAFLDEYFPQFKKTWYSKDSKRSSSRSRE